MNTIELGNITLEIENEKTEKFYESQNGFICECKDCINYKSKIPEVHKLIGELVTKSGIDLTKDVGQGTDELQPIDLEDYHLDLIPYYVVGKCFVNGTELAKQPHGPLLPSTIKVKYKMNKDLSLIFKNSSDYIQIDSSNNTLTIWLEYKTIYNE